MVLLKCKDNNNLSRPMKFNIRSKTILIDDRIKEIIESKISSLSKIIPHEEVIPVDVELEKNVHHQKGDIYKLEIQFLFKGGRLVRAVAEKESIILAVTEIKKELEVQINKHNKKPIAVRKKVNKEEE
jgi:ribosomal subunit interface protein